MTSESTQRANYPDLSALAEVYLFELTDQRGLGALYSDRERFNKLANLFGFFGLPA